MSKRCDISGAGPSSGNNVSHSKRHTRRKWYPNLKKKRVFVSEQNRWITLRLTAASLRTLSKRGTSSLA